MNNEGKESQTDKILNAITSQAEVKVIRTKEFKDIANPLSELLLSLKIERSVYNDLISLMKKQVEQAEHDALLQGFEMGIKIMKADREGKV